MNTSSHPDFDSLQHLLSPCHASHRRISVFRRREFESKSETMASSVSSQVSAFDPFFCDSTNISKSISCIGLNNMVLNRRTLSLERCFPRTFEFLVSLLMERERPSLFRDLSLRLTNMRNDIRNYPIKDALHEICSYLYISYFLGEDIFSQFVSLMCSVSHDTHDPDRNNNSSSSREEHVSLESSDKHTEDFSDSSSDSSSSSEDESSSDSDNESCDVSSSSDKDDRTLILNRTKYVSPNIADRIPTQFHFLLDADTIKDAKCLFFGSNGQFLCESPFLVSRRPVRRRREGLTFCFGTPKGSRKFVSDFFSLPRAIPVVVFPFESDGQNGYLILISEEMYLCRVRVRPNKHPRDTSPSPVSDASKEKIYAFLHSRGYISRTYYIASFVVANKGFTSQFLDRVIVFENSNMRLRRSRRSIRGESSSIRLPKSFGTSSAVGKAKRSMNKETGSALARERVFSEKRAIPSSSFSSSSSTTTSPSSLPLSSLSDVFTGNGSDLAP